MAVCQAAHLVITIPTDISFVEDARALRDNLINVDILLSKMNSCINNMDFDLSTFFTYHGIDVDGVTLTRENIILHFLNGRRIG